MSIKANTNSRYWIGLIEKSKIKTVTRLIVTFFISIPVCAQVSELDSTQITGLIANAHEQLIKHDYQEAIEQAQKGLDRSNKLGFKWGLINSSLIIAQAQKASQNFPASLNHYLQVLSEVEKQHDQKLLEWTNEKIGELFQDWGVPEKALLYYNTALSMYPSQTDRKATSLLDKIAQVHFRLNQNEQSLKTYFQLLSILQENKDTVQVKNTLEKIAFIYSRSDDVENSLKYNLKILEINKQLKDNFSTASTLNTIGNHYKELKNLDKALEYYQASLALNKRTNKRGANDNSIVTNLINIGVIYQSRGDARNSIKSFNEALVIKEKSGTPVEIAVMHNYLASLYLTQTNYSEAEDHTKRAISLLTGTDNKRMLATNYKRLSEIYGKQGNYEKSLVSYQAYSMLKDSLLFQEQLSQEKEKIKEYIIETTEKEAKLSLIDHEIQALELRNEKEITEREKKEIALLLKEKELQNLSLQKEQLEQAKAVQHLQLQQGKIEKEKQEQAIVLLEQKRDLQNAEIQKNELQEKERQKEIAYKNTELALKQSQLEQGRIQQQYLGYTVVSFFILILLITIGYIIKQRDNKKLTTQYQEINRQKEQIESINKSLVELNEEKNDLISIVAHDLKSPLNQISGMLEIVKLTSNNQPGEQQEYTTKIEESTNRLKKMVTKILDVSAIESKTLNLKIEEFNIDVVLNEIVDRFTTLAAKKNITVQKEFETGIPSIKSDVGYVSEALENLMSNAVKYSPLGKQITVRLKNSLAFVRIEFIDEGQGISEKDMKNLFGKYHKLSAKPTAGEDSTGLGLSIVKKYIQTLNGKVWCESEEGKGSNFIVELPVG